MNAHEFNNEYLPHLEVSEIEEFKYLAQAEGVPRLADFPHLQPTQKPAFYMLTLSAEAIDRRWPLIPRKDNEVVVGLSIEYNESIVDEDGENTPSAVAVDIYSIVGDTYSGRITEKEIRYLLPLDPTDPSTVTEFHSDEAPHINAADRLKYLTDEELLDRVQARADKRRPLTYDDVQLLRYLIRSA
jgi:hypothetical protein